LTILKTGLLLESSSPFPAFPISFEMSG